MRIAAIDIGTNSIHMVIARSTGAAGFELADREREVVQIGRGSFASGRLQAAAMRRTLEALKRFVDLARRRQVDRILCTATAAVREARNGGQFIDAAREVSGITPRVIPPEEEGRLIYLAVKGALRFGTQPALIVDIGGGSAQLVVADGERLIESRSAPLGALRLTERLLHLRSTHAARPGAAVAPRAPRLGRAARGDRRARARPGLRLFGLDPRACRARASRRNRTSARPPQWARPARVPRSNACSGDCSA